LFLIAHAKANYAYEHPNSLASSPKPVSFLTVASFFVGSNHSLILLPTIPSSVILDPSGKLPSLYFPVNNPPANGDQIVLPYLYLSNN